MSDQNAALFDKLDGFYVTKSEHDWLERRFSNMTEKEKILFQGAMELSIPECGAFGGRLPPVAEWSLL